MQVSAPSTLSMSRRSPSHGLYDMPRGAKIGMPRVSEAATAPKPPLSEKLTCATVAAACEFWEIGAFDISLIEFALLIVINRACQREPRHRAACVYNKLTLYNHKVKAAQKAVANFSLLP